MKLIRTETKFVYESEKYKIQIEQVKGLESELSLYDKEEGTWDKELLCVKMADLEKIREKINICIETFKNPINELF
jgi:hypothetical protein